MILLWRLKRKFGRLIKLLEGFDRVTVLYHKDGDGLVSAAIFSKLLENLGIKHKILPRKNSSKRIKGPLIFLDCSPRGEKIPNVIVIDHHIEKEEPWYLFYLNFRDFFKKARSNAFYLCLSYNFFWKSDPVMYFVSAYQDGALGESLDIIRKVVSKEDYTRFYYREFLNPFVRILCEIPNISLCEDELDGRVIEIMKEVLDVGLEVFESKGKEIFEIAGKVLEYNRKAIEIIEEVRDFGDVIFVKVRDEKKLYRLTIPYITSRFKKKVYLFVKEKNDKVKISLRSPYVDLVDVMRRIEERVSITWGGHRGAVGGTVGKENFERFLKELLREVG